MRRLMTTAIILACVAGTTNVVPANEPAPPKLEPAAVALHVTVDQKAEKAKLLIPAKLRGDGNGVGQKKVGDAGGLRTVIAGLAMSCAVGCAWFVFRRKKGATAALIGAFVAIGAGTFVWANGGPPPRRLEPPHVSGQVDVVFDDNVQTVTLVLPSKLASQVGQLGIIDPLRGALDPTIITPPKTPTAPTPPNLPREPDMPKVPRPK